MFGMNGLNGRPAAQLAPQCTAGFSRLLPVSNEKCITCTVQGKWIFVRWS